MAGFSIDGINSSLDTTAIIDAIIESESGSLNHLKQRHKETLEISATYNTISASMLALKTHATALAKSATLDMYSTIVSDPEVLTAKATAGATPGSYMLNVTSLARNHQIASQGFESTDTGSLGEGTVSIGIGDGSLTTITIDETSNSLTGLKNAINDADIGIMATIIDDGTSQNPFRLVLTAQDSGAENTIQFSTNVSDGQAPDFATAAFDTVETDQLSADSTSIISLGATAAYTGSENKTYTFTIGGSGQQTIGEGTITINWTDGTNSGSIEVDAADTEVALAGDGADGLTISFGPGALNAGDIFEVQAFAPTLQTPADAKISLGSTTGGGSPIVISSASNRVESVIPGVTLDLFKISDGPIEVAVSVDQSGIKSKITAMLEKYNEVMDRIDKQFEYNEVTGESGTLIGDSYVLAMQQQVRSALSGAIGGLPKSMNMLASIGIRTGDNGHLNLTSTSELNAALNSNLEGVKNLFRASGTSDNSLVSFLSATPDTVPTSEGYEVDITQVATHGYARGDTIHDPVTQPLTIDSTNNTFRVTIDGVTSEDIVLTEKTYSSSAELVAELQTKLDADENVGKLGATFAWVPGAVGSGYLELMSASYGSNSQVSYDLSASNGAKEILGLTNDNKTSGADVAGTINGEAATGHGQVLTGNDGNETTDGLKVTVRFSEGDLNATAPEATVTYAEGFAARLDRVLDSITKSLNGSIARRTKALDDQAEYYSTLIDDYTERLEIRRQDLYEKFYEMERVLGELQSQGAYFSSQLQQAQSLFGSIS